MRVDEDTSAERSGVRITGRNLRVDLDWGSGARVRGGASDDRVNEALRSHAGTPEASFAFEVVADAQVREIEVGRGGMRGEGDGGDAESGLVVELGRESEDERRVVLVEEDGEFGWFFPEPGADRIDLAASLDVAGSRGVVSNLARRVIRVVALKPLTEIAAWTAGTLVGEYEKRLRAPSLRSWTASNFRRTGVEEPDLHRLEGGRSLLIVHGFIGSIHGTFGFEDDMVRRLVNAYEHRTMAYDHPTLTVTPGANARDLLERLGERDLEIDVLAHSRGGLVAREFAQQAKGSGIDVRSIVFVGTPNAGTPLADPEKPAGLLDAATNLIDFIPGSDGVAIVMEMLADVAFRGALRGLDGLTAMEPSGEYITDLNAKSAERLPDGIVLRSIATEFEPAATAGFLQAKLDAALDSYFGQARNDRVVPTASTHATAGTFQVPPGQRLVLDSSRGVHHTSFWTAARATEQMLAWLAADEDPEVTPPVPENETDPEVELAEVPDSTDVEAIVAAVVALPEQARKAFETLTQGDAPPTPPRGDRPAVIVLPGIMGSNLSIEDRGRVWIDVRRLSGGGFGDLRFGPGATAIGRDHVERQLTATGLNRTYVKLIAHLARNWDVHLFPFDWRDDIFRSGDRLAEFVQWVDKQNKGKGVNLVAHSMGGLVSRAFIANHPRVWESLAARGDMSQRLVMLGTPNRGSYSIPMALLGKELVMRGVALIDRRHDVDDIAKIAAEFPGIYQMLPYPNLVDGIDDDWERLYDVRSWPKASFIRQDLLTLARETHEHLEQRASGTDRFCYVAGYGKDTPYRVAFDGGESGAMRIGKFAMGDGRVAHVLGELDEMKTYFVDASHGGLVEDDNVLRVLDALTANGEADTDDAVLESAPPRRGVGGDKPDMWDVDDVDPQPLPIAGVATRGGPGRATIEDAQRVLDDSMALLVGGQAAAGNRPQVDVKVVHASLEQTPYPVAVGHYSYVPPAGAEGFLSAKLDGALDRRYELDLNADRAGDAMVITAREGHRPGGAVVVGLGEFGSLTESTLSDGVSTGVLRLVRRRVEAGHDAREAAGLASVLIGTPGRYGLSIDSSVVAIVEGAIRAIIRLGDQRPDRFTVELIELYSQTSDSAATAVGKLVDEVDQRLLEHVDLRIEPRVLTRAGGRSGAPPQSQSGQPWIRVQAELERTTISGARWDGADRSVELDPIGMVRMMVLARRAQADRLDHSVDLDKIHDYVETVIANQRVEGVGQTLFELLLSHDAKLELDRTENVHLLIDEHLGDLPWELLAGRDQGGTVRPLAQRAGLLRQLRSDEPRRSRPVHPEGLQALVIGDPPTHLARLPGARREAEHVAQLLTDDGWSVSELIYSAEDRPGRHIEIDSRLHGAPYRLVHIAAHGLFDEKNPKRSGVVIGDQPHHRLSSIDFRQMSVQPDLVFLNCCHLGRLRESSPNSKIEDVPREYRQPHRVAGTVARQLLLNGVKAVIVAGWAVDDHAADAFASTLYRRLLEREPLGEAVQSARADAFEADGGRSNTWGAYQCYGDPDFQLVVGSKRHGRADPVVSPGQLIGQLQVLETNAGQALRQSDRDRLESRLRESLGGVGDLRSEPKVALALADAYRALGWFAEAAAEYDRSIKASRGETELRAIEQRANMKIRAAAKIAENGGSIQDFEAIFSSARRSILALIEMAGSTPERQVLLGSAHKKRALVLRRRTGTRGEAAVRRALEDAIDAYNSADKIRREDEGTDHVHGANVAIQLARVMSAAGSTVPQELRGRTARIVSTAQKQAETPTVFWDRSQLADSMLSQALLGSGDGARDDANTASALYCEAFRNQSSFADRDSVVTHLEELSLLAERLRAEDSTMLAMLQTLRNEVREAAIDVGS